MPADGKVTVGEVEEGAQPPPTLRFSPDPAPYTCLPGISTRCSLQQSLWEKEKIQLDPSPCNTRVPRGTRLLWAVPAMCWV